MNKRIISVFLAAAMSFSMTAQVFAEPDGAAKNVTTEQNSGADTGSGGGGQSGQQITADKTVAYGDEAFGLSDIFGDKKLVSSNEDVLKIDKDNKVNIISLGSAYVYAENEEETKYTIKVEARTVEAENIGIWNKKYDGTTAAQIIGSAYGVKNALDGDDVYVDASTATAEFENSDAGENKKVTVSGIRLAGADAANYKINAEAESKANISEELTAATVAASIESLYLPKGSKKLEIPSLDGFDISIYSSDTEEVIAKDGSVTAYAEDKTVKLVLEVTEKTVAPSATPSSEEINKPIQLAEQTGDAVILPMLGTDKPAELENTADTAKTKEISVTVFAAATADITCKAENGSVTGTGSYAMGDEAELTATADDEYIFEGWYLGGKLVGRENPYKFNVTHSAEYTAKFIKKNSKTVYITTEYTGLATEITGGGEYYFGDTVTLTAVNEKYFRYWAVDGVKVSEKAQYSFAAVEDVTVTAVMYTSSGGGSLNYKYKYQTVNFETNGGTPMSSVKVARNTVMKMPEDPTRTGYRFDGWYSDEALTKKYTFRERVLEDMTLYAAWTKISYSGGSNETKDVPYTDVSEKDWYYDAVKYMYRNEIMAGMTKTSFEPNTTLTRAMFVTVLYRASGEKYTGGKLPFIDVGRDMWYSEAVGWAVANGIVSGYSDTIFAPDDTVTREQMAAMIYRFAKYRGYDMSGSASISAFSDANEVSDWALAAVKWAVDLEILSGMSDTRLAPQGTATRAQCASMIKRCMENLDFMKTEE